MAGNPGVRVSVTRVIRYTYDEHFFDEDGIRDLESTLSGTVSFRDRAQCYEYSSAAHIEVWEIPA